MYTDYMELLSYLIKVKGIMGFIWLTISILALGKTIHLNLKRKGDYNKHF